MGIVAMAEAAEVVDLTSGQAGTGGSVTVMFCMSPVWLDSSDVVVILRMAGATVTVCAGTVVYVGMMAVFTMHVMLGSATINMAASGGTEGRESFSSSESSKAHSHLMQK